MSNHYLRKNLSALILNSSLLSFKRKKAYYSFTLIEILIAFSLMAFCAAYLIKETFSFREKHTFHQNCREIRDLFIEAAALSHMTHGEVDVVVEMCEPEDSTPQKKALSIRLVIWNAAANPIKNRIEKKRFFFAVHTLSIDGTGHIEIGKGDSKTVFRFYPRGIDISGTHDALITCTPFSSTAKYSFSLLEIAPRLHVTQERHSIPDSIEQLAV